MKTKPKLEHTCFPLSIAYEIAVNALNTLISCCDKIHIAGSIRRKKEFVHDIEIVCLPKEISSKDMFGEEKTIRDSTFEKTVNTIGKVIIGNANGRMMQIELSESIILDLFIANKINYGNILLIRTGDWEFSRFFMGTVLRKNGYHSEGGFVKKNEEIIPTPDEDVLFKLCKLPFIDPEKRNLKTLQNIFLYDKD